MPTPRLTAEGVVFVSEPKDQFYGVEAVFKDPFGNWAILGTYSCTWKI